MILQTSLWQFVNFTCTVFSPAFASWARNWYWSLPGKFLLVTPPIWRSAPIVHGGGGGGVRGERGYHVNGPQTNAKIYWSILKTFFHGWKIPVIPTFSLMTNFYQILKKKLTDLINFLVVRVHFLTMVVNFQVGLLLSLMRDFPQMRISSKLLEL